MVYKKNAKSNTKNNYSYQLNIPSNTKYLIVHESPKESKTATQFKDKIEKQLWWPVVLLATTGHFYITSPSSIDINTNTWMPNFKVDSNRKNVIDNLKKAFAIVKKNKWQVIIGTDPDREWEVIAYSVYDVLKLKKWQYKRMRMRSLAEKDYLDALKNVEDELNWNMVDSGIARQVLDKVIWYKLTPSLWNIGKEYRKYINNIDNSINNFLKDFNNKYDSLIKENANLWKMINKYQKLDFKQLNDFENRKFTSIWRVQTPTLRLLVEKDLSKFEKDLKRKLNLFLLDKDKNKWEYINNKKFENDTNKIEKINNIVSSYLKDNNIKELEIVDIISKKQKISPPTPLNTQKAQSAISNMFWYWIEKIMKILQENYQNGWSSYMRTDSIDITDEFKTSIKNIIKKNWIKAKFVNKDYKSKNAQEGHHAILPTQEFNLNSLPWTWDNQKIVEYVTRRSVASLLEDAEIEYINYVVAINLEYKWKKQTVKFLLKDTKIIKKWFLEVFIYQLWDYKTKYNFKKWDKILIDKLEIKQKNIKLPWTYTEASIVEELEKLWIGRPSTYVSIVKTIKQKEYVKSVWKKLEIQEKWYWVYQMIKDNPQVFEKITDLDFTAKMENWLDEIANWEKDKNNVIEEVLKYLWIKM